MAAAQAQAARRLQIQVQEAYAQPRPATHPPNPPKVGALSCQAHALLQTGPLPPAARDSWGLQALPPRAAPCLASPSVLDLSHALQLQPQQMGCQSTLSCSRLGANQGIYLNLNHAPQSSRVALARSTRNDPAGTLAHMLSADFQLNRMKEGIKLVDCHRMMQTSHKIPLHVSLFADTNPLPRHANGSTRLSADSLDEETSLIAASSSCVQSCSN